MSAATAPEPDTASPWAAQIAAQVAAQMADPTGTRRIVATVADGNLADPAVTSELGRQIEAATLISGLPE